MIEQPKALIFDCDGTLALTGDLHFNAFERAFALQSAVIDRSFYDARTGLPRDALIEDWNLLANKKVDASRLHADSLAEAKALAATGSVRENAPVAQLARAWGSRPSAVASNGERSVVIATLRACALFELFDTVVTVEDVTTGKPDPAMFVLAAERLGAAPKDCVVLEDSEQGLEAARRANIHVLDVRTASALAEIGQLMSWIELVSPISTPEGASFIA